MKFARALVALLFTCGLCLTAVADGDPNLAFQAFVNGKVVTNGRGLITGQTLNQAFNLLPPVFYSMGSWDVNGKFTLNLPSLPLSNVMLTVDNNAALAALPTTLVTRVRRLGFATPGDGGEATFTAGTSICAGDGGSQVPSLDLKCWNAVFNGRPSVLMWGAKTDGSADAGPAFAAACAARPGDTFDVPPGVYWFNSAQTFSSPCLFEGRGFNERQNEAALTPVRTGTWIRVTNPTIRPITLDFRGSGGLRRIGFEQNQPAPASGWAPTVYQPIITMGPNAFGEIFLEDLYLWGIYDFLDQGQAGVIGHLFINRIRGQPFHTVINVTAALDMIHADDWHLFPYWSLSPYAENWTQANGHPILLARMDGWQSSHLFMYGYNTCADLGYKSSGGNTGPTTSFSVGDLYCDAAKIGVHVTGNNVTAHFGKLTFFGGKADGTAGLFPGSTAYLDEASGTTVDIGRLVSSGSGGSAVSLTNAAGNANVTIGSSFIANPNGDNNGSAVFAIAPSTGLSRINLMTPPAIIGTLNGAAVGAANGNVITEVWQPWTPTLYGDATAGTPVYGSDTKGRFIIHGDNITVAGYVSANLTGAAGNLLIGGLPFPNQTDISVSAALGFGSSIPMTGGYTFPTLVLPSGSKAFQIIQNGPGLGSSLVGAGGNPTPTIGFGATYRAF